MADPFLKTPPDRQGIILGGGIAAACGLFFLYSSVRGLLAFRAGSVEASAEPGICLFGLVAGVWMLRMGFRILRHAEKPLLSPPELLVASIGAMVGAVWFYFRVHLGLLASLAFLGIGFLGLMQWRHQRSVK